MNKAFYILTVVMLFLGAQQCYAQLSSEGQAVMDSMQQYMMAEMAEGRQPDQEKLQWFNERIKTLETAAKARSKAAALECLAEGAVLREMELLKGSSLVVPEGVTWRVKDLYVKEQMGTYQIVVNSVDKSRVYQPGEKLRTPSMAAEEQLLDGEDDMNVYIYQIEERIINN